MIIWLATTNLHKIKEMRSFFKASQNLQFKDSETLQFKSSQDLQSKTLQFKSSQDLQSKTLQFKSLEDLQNYIPPEETGTSFKENAKIKALKLFETLEQKKDLQLDSLVVAEDSGLEVEALNKEPGVYSARYSGLQATDQKNNQFLLQKMEAKTSRKAQYVCSLCVLTSKKKYHYFQGVCKGSIATQESGQNGFGYDSLFIPEGHTQTFGTLLDKDKQSLSHRSQALKQFETQIINNNFF